MIVESVHFDAADSWKVTIVLRPSWLGRIFGGRRCSVRLQWNTDAKTWYSATSGLVLKHMPHRRLLKKALCMQFIDDVPSARVISAEGVP